ncbi:ABC transporter ATP-binding protein [Paenibacillus taiwanensis]|uniref:ABC transporter ATP-binding protein n=1 Tax=Paenibacillus taiwanensis TaxID=401638 RepID=UPI00146B352A|nr:ABC transporter ATP-binding protein [Paenibacillus taiwanensis]
MKEEASLPNSSTRFIWVSKYILKFLLYTWKIAPVHLSLLLFIRLLQSTVPSLQLFITKELIDSITEAFKHGGMHISSTYSFLMLQTLLLLFSQLCLIIEKINKIKMQQKINLFIETNIATKTSSLSLSYFDNSEFYDLLLRASSGQSQRVVDLMNGPMQIVQNTLTLATLIGILAHFHWLAAVTVVVMSLPPLLLHLREGKLRYKLLTELTPLSRRINYYFNLLIGRTAAKEVRLFELQSHFLNRWKLLFNRSANLQLTFECKNSYYQGLVEALNTIFVSIILAWFIWMGVHQKLSLGEYVAISQAYLTVQGLMLGIALSISGIYENTLSLRDMFRFLELPSEVCASEEMDDTIPFPALRKKGITVHNLSFKYSADTSWILKDISFSILPGKKIAIVGNNGAGKSTLIKCLLGLYRTYEGTILYEDVDLKQIPSKVLLRNASAVFQDFVKYEQTVKENIGYGNMDRMTDEEILAAAKKGDAHSFVQKLELGYETELGTSFNGGTELSGGQWQKLAVSRAFIKNADIVVLDEPTASLDPYAEDVLYNTFSELANGKITILISHRLSSCINADLILVMNNGKIVEQGTHEELMLINNGNYAEMFRLQSQKYQPDIVHS